MLWERIRHVFILNHFQIKKQIYLVFCLTIVIPVSILGFFIIEQTLESLRDRAHQQLESDNTRAKSILFDATLNFFNISDYIIADEQLKTILQEEYASLQEARVACDSYKNLEFLLVNNASISSLRVYTENNSLPVTGYIQSFSSSEVENWFELVKTPGSVHWESNVSEQFGQKTTELIMVRSFPFTNREHAAIVVIRMSNNHLKNRIQNNDLFISLSLNQEPIFFSTQRALQGTYETAPIDYGKKFFQSRGELEYQGKKAFSYISSFIPYHAENAILYFTSLDFSAPGYIVEFLILDILILAVAIVASCAIILVFARYLSKRIAHLKNVMHDASNGNFNTIGSFKGDDELSVIFVDLRTMIANVQEQQARIYRSQLKEQELINQQQKMEFRLLASQINPHFIYNTLETIRLMALSEGARDVAGATALFGKTMRYILENIGPIQTTLDKELSYVENYMAIQKLRFEDKVDYSISMPEGFEPSAYQILPLLLQPIVENAVSHGIKESPRQQLIIQVIVEPQEENERLIIRVEDNGAGIAKKELEKLRKHISENSGEMVTANIGLFNIYQRIKLFYGDDFSFEIESTEGHGTYATVTLPMMII